MDATPLYAAGLGWTAGMRSMTPTALLSRALADRSGVARLLGRGLPADLLGSRLAAAALPTAALGEIVADKTPFIPARTTALPLLGRIGLGAACGAALAVARRSEPVSAAVAGAVAAGVSSFVMMKARASLGEALGAPDPAVALAEDVLAIGGASALVSAALG